MIKERLIQVIESKGIAKENFYKEIGMTSASFRGKFKKTSLNSDAIESIITLIPDINLSWLLTGKGDMLIDGSVRREEVNLIKLHNDVATIGGRDLSSNGVEAGDWEYIDAGGWFPNATAAVRHYGDSMVEYPSGCILVLKQLHDLRNGFILGQNYVIEYGEDYNRVTKRVQRKGDQYIAYSSNEKTSMDGTLIHQPFELRKIHRAWLVIGCVLKTVGNSVIDVKP